MSAPGARAAVLRGEGAPHIAPSILAADFGALAEAVAQAEAGGATLIHVDVMDGHFVPNITMGPVVVRAIARRTRLPVDVHLMIEAPDRYLEAFADAGADFLTVHQEAVPHLNRTIQAIHALGLGAGVAINPATPVGALEEIAPDVDLVLVMSVNPGFSGQAYLPRSESKLSAVRSLLDRTGSTALISVDGGIDADNIGRVVSAGASICVVGAAVYSTPDPAAAVRALREAAVPGARALRP